MPLKNISGQSDEAKIRTFGRTLKVFTIQVSLLEYWDLTTRTRIWFKPMLGGVSVVAISANSHEQTQLNRICCFKLCRFSLFLKDRLT